jgi:hypothetical protein
MKREVESSEMESSVVSLRLALQALLRLRF